MYMCLCIKWQVYAYVYSIKYYMIYVYHNYYCILLLLYISIILKVIMWSNDNLYDLCGITCFYWTVSLSTVIKSFILIY